jgi:hypothetical protein
MHIWQLITFKKACLSKMFEPIRSVHRIKNHKSTISMKFLLNLLLFTCFTTISIAAKKPAADSVVISVTSIADMQAYAGQSKSVIVKDIYKGGIFNKLPKRRNSTR